MENVIYIYKELLLTLHCTTDKCDFDINVTQWQVWYINLIKNIEYKIF